MWCTESYVRKSGVPMFREDRACNSPVEDGHRVIFRATARSIEGTRSVCRRYPKPPNMSQGRSPPAGFKSVFEPGGAEFMVTSDRRLGSYRSSCHQRVWPFWVGGWLRPAASGTRAAGAELVGRQGAAHEALLRRPRDRSRRLPTPCPSASSPGASAPDANRLPGTGTEGSRRAGSPAKQGRSAWQSP